MFDLKTLIAEKDHLRLDLIDQHINPTFAKVLRILGYDINFTKGIAQYLYDQNDNRYLDCIAGFGTFACGRNHPVIRQAITDAMNLDLPNLPKFAPPALSGLLAEKLISLTPPNLDTAYFCNSGAEALETAIKYARAATGRNRIIYCKKAYHGLTLGALSINGGEEFSSGFGHLLTDTTPIPFNDLSALQHELQKDDAAAFIVEPIQGKGVFVPDDDYLPTAAELCKKHGTLFVADEVQTGLGRTGKLFACQHYNIEPDILCLSKALSGGYVPVAAVLSNRSTHNAVFSSLDRVVVHSTTFGQNDLAMAAGLATLAVLHDENIIDNAARMGQSLHEQLAEFVDEFDLVKEVRGKGLMLAIEFGAPTKFKLKLGWQMLHKVDAGLFPQAILVPLLKEHHILALVAGHHMDVVKLLPSLVINQSDVDHLVASLRKTIAACHKFPGPTWQILKGLTPHLLKSKKSKKPSPKKLTTQTQ